MIFPQEHAHKIFHRTVVLTKRNCFDGSVLAEEAGVFRCMIRKIGNDSSLKQFEINQNYVSRSPSAGDLAMEAVLELTSGLHPDWNSMRIGIPLSEVKGEREFTVAYTGTKFLLLAGDRVLDEEYPFGDPPGTPVSSGGMLPDIRRKSEFRRIPLHGWSPEMPNEWGGDVSVGCFNGAFHIFYLYDRRHHRSKFGQGGHQWGHLATKDFRVWRDDGVILPLTAQWQSFGTGTPFLLNGNMALAYGLHTERFLPPGTGARGMTWAVSGDGIHFVPSEISVDDMTENPSVYNQKDGSWIVYDNGVLSRAVRWPEFRKLPVKPIPCGEISALLNSYECPSLFEWNGYYFMLVGFTGMYRSRELSFEHFDDLAGNGLDLYDGLKVPMVAPFAENRRILAGWLGISGWGGILGVRELVWFDDAVPGIRWLDEAMPEVADRKMADRSVSFPGEGCFEFMMQPGEDLLVELEGDGKSVELSLNASLKRASVAAGGDCPTLCEQGRNWRKLSPPGFAVDHLRGIGQAYKVRMMVREERKWNGCVVDVEIASCRTLIHHFEQIHLTEATVRKGPAQFLAGKLKRG